MKKYLTGFLIFLLFSYSLLAQNGPTVIDQVVAVVGNTIILESEVEAQYLQLAGQHNVDTSKKEMVKCQILNELLLQKLLLNQANVDSVTVSESQINAELDRRIRFFINQIGSQEKLEEYYNKSILEIKNEFKGHIKDQLLTQTMQGKITKDINVTPAEVRAYYESVPKDSLPLISAELEIGQMVKKPFLSEEEKQEVKERLNALRERVLKGESFSALAALYSEDIASARKGGELGFVNRGELVPEFEAAAFSLKPGEISKIIETQYGFHVIQSIERRGDQVNVRHILLKPKVSSQSLNIAKEKLDSIYNLLVDKKFTFAQAAEKFSDDTETKFNGGLMINPQTGTTKWEPDQLEPTIFFTVDKLKLGEESKPVLIQSPDGKQSYRIFYLKVKTEPHKANLKDDYQRIQQMALNQKQNKAMLSWVKKKKSSTAITIDKDFLKKSAVCPEIVKDWVKQ